MFLQSLILTGLPTILSGPFLAMRVEKHLYPSLPLTYIKMDDATPPPPTVHKNEAKTSRIQAPLPCTADGIWSQSLCCRDRVVELGYRVPGHTLTGGM